MWTSDTSTLDFAVDEIYGIRRPRVGLWKFARSMKDDRPHFRFWVVGIAGTLINPDPLDIQSAMEIMSSAEWDAERYSDHTLSSKSLKAMQRAIDKR